MKNLTIFILLFGYFYNIHADYSLTVLLNEFNNGQGFLADGNHCSSFWYSGVQCNIQLIIKVDLTDSSTYDPDFACNNNMTITINLGQVTSNANKISFGEQSYGSWKNPQIFNADGYYDGFQLCVEAKEATTGKLIDSFAADRIDTFRVDDFTFYSHQRLNETIDPTMIAYAWNVRGDMNHPQPTRPPTTIPTTTPSLLAVDCEDALTKGLISSSQALKIVLAGNKEVDVYCEVQGKTAQTVIQSRGEDLENADFDMKEYDDFVDPIGKPGPKNHFWLGLDNMNLLTTGRNNRYNLSIVACCGNKEIARQFYHTFMIGNSSNKYVLQASAENSYGLNAFGKDLGQQFKTNATYNIGPPRRICSVVAPKDNPDGNVGGWWVGSCSNNLNGHYYSLDSEVFKDPTTCTLDKTAAFAAFGSGIELNNGPPPSDDFITWISATRVRMAVYRTDGQGVPVTTNFCKN